MHNCNLVLSLILWFTHLCVVWSWILRNQPGWWSGMSYSTRSRSFTSLKRKKWSLLNCFLHTWRSLIHCCLAIPDSLSNVMKSSEWAFSFFPHTIMFMMTNQREGRIRPYCVRATLKMVWFFAVERMWSLGFDRHQCCTLLINGVHPTESHMLTHAIECAPHLPTLCCACWNEYCAMVVWLLF